MADLPPIREALERHGLWAKKRFGQHFLLDLNLTRRIAKSAGDIAGKPVIEVGPGPAFHVYLVPAANVRDAGQVTGTMFVDLGGLRAFKGSQRYSIPVGVDPKDYQSVVIWCERFSVLISPADLRTAVAAK